MSAHTRHLVRIHPRLETHQAPAHAIFAALVAILAAIVGTGLVMPTQAFADGEVTWTVRTGDNGFGAQRSSYSYSINPGTELSDSIVITNRGSESLELGIYAADGFTNDDGQLDLQEAVATPTGVGGWVHGEGDRLSIDPGTSVEYPFTVSVPENATPGDYVGGILTSLTSSSDASQVNTDRRLGIKIALRVSGDLAPSIAVENTRLDWSGSMNPFAGGDATLSYTIRNTGNTVIAALHGTDVTGPFGIFPSEVKAEDDLPQLLPGETWDVSTVVHVAPLVWLTGTATVVPLALDAAGTTSQFDPVYASASTLAVPWLLLLLLAVLGALVWLGIRLRRQSAVRRQEHEDARVHEAVQQALSSNADSISEPGESDPADPEQNSRL
nr:DUF916 domain-containing protein [Propionicimonas sp.]